jgi:hypothetical protein
MVIDDSGHDKVVGCVIDTACDVIPVTVVAAGCFDNGTEVSTLDPAVLLSLVDDCLNSVTLSSEVSVAVLTGSISTINQPLLVSILGENVDSIPLVTSPDTTNNLPDEVAAQELHVTQVSSQCTSHCFMVKTYTLM